MNGKTSKLLRSYAGQCSRDGVPVVWKHVKRRYAALPWFRRDAVKSAMSEYLSQAADAPLGELRRGKPGVKVVKKTKLDLFGMIGQMLGLVWGRSNAR